MNNKWIQTIYSQFDAKIETVNFLLVENCIFSFKCMSIWDWLALLESLISELFKDWKD